MSVKLELEITLDSKGAVSGIKTLDTAIGGLDKSTQGADRSSQGLWKQMALGILAYNAASKAVSFFTGFVKDSVSEAIKAESATAALASALSITGRPVEALSKHFDEYAKALQNVTIYDDEAIKKTQTLLVQLTNLDRDGLDRATKGAIGLAAVMGGDLQGATSIVTKAMNGNMMALAKLGITVDTTKTKEQQRNEVLDKLIALYPRATAEGKTFGGGLKILTNQYHDMQESFGDAILKGLKPAMAEMSKPENMAALKRFGDGVGAAIGAYIVGFTKMGIEIEQQVKSIGGFVKNGLTWMGLLKTSEEDLAKAIGGHDYVLKEDNKTVDAATAGTNKLKEVTEKHTEAVKSQTQVFEERWQATYKQFEEDKAYAAFVESKFIPVIKSYSDAWADNFDITNMMIETEKTFDAEIKKQADQIMNENIPAVDDWKFSWGEARQALGSIRGSLADLGIDLGDVGNALLDTADSAMGFVSALASGNPLAIIAAGFQLICDVVSLLGEIFNTTMTAAQQAIATMNIELAKLAVEAAREAALIKEQFIDTWQAVSVEALHAFIIMGDGSVAFWNSQAQNIADTKQKFLDLWKSASAAAEAAYAIMTGAAATLPPAVPVPPNVPPPNVPKKKYSHEEPAAEGYHNWVAGGSYTRFVTGEREPERVDITPKSKIGDYTGNAGGAKTYNFYFEGQVNSENVLTILADGISGNKYGIRSKLESLGSN